MSARARRVRRNARRAVVALTAAAVLAACSGGEPGSPDPTTDPTSPAADHSDAPTAEPTAEPTTDDPALSGDLVVHAAASLTDTFADVAEAFTAEHPDVTVTFNFGGSSGLAQQILSGAPGDVFAAASPATMATVVDGGMADGEPEVFVMNTLQIVVPAGNPGSITSLADFADPAKRIGLCAVEVPCGAASDRVFQTTGLTPAPDTFTRDVRGALTLVEIGEVDAALVYRTDVASAGDTVEGIDFPEAAAAVNDYSIALLVDAANAAAAWAFIDFVLSEGGRAILGDAGFDLP